MRRPSGNGGWLALGAILAIPVALLLAEPSLRVTNECSGYNPTGETACSYLYGYFLVIADGFLWFSDLIKRDDNDVVVVAFATVAVAVFTAFLWWSTYRLWKSGERQGDALRRSIDEAARSADAMTRIADRTEITGERFQVFSKKQMRAYLAVEVGSEGFFQDANFIFEVRPTVTNTGFTPAHGVTYWATADILAVPLPKSFTFPEPREKVEHAFTLAPRQGLVLNAMIPRIENIEVVERAKVANGVAPYIWGIISYIDEFGDPHWTKFCHHIYWVDTPKGTQLRGVYANRNNETDR